MQKLHAYQAHSPKKKSSAERGTVLTYPAIGGSAVTAQGYQRGRETFAEITSGNFEIVLGFALGASSMPVKWNRRVFWLRFFEDKINRASEDPGQETESGRLVRAEN